ncbi:hypothetical protein AVEN_189973-1 [Araneus ventricosus]|uniref:Uncharacterized protein n=1 Tax=Araneus ventricosus TaxID=182803 RepID=A0A4Y2X1Z8_ARAVE|nr:hypothetical protein AVEN_189973-1 [Araneus ventricosus]
MLPRIFSYVRRTSRKKLDFSLSSLKTGNHNSDLSGALIPQSGKSLAKEGTTMPKAYVELLKFIYSRRKVFANISWRHPPAHSWYRSEGSGATIHFKRYREDRTALARSTSGHLKTLRSSRGDKKFNN